MIPRTEMILARILDELDDLTVTVRTVMPELRMFLVHVVLFVAIYGGLVLAIVAATD